MNELEQLLYLSGIKSKDNSFGKSITLSGTEKARIMRENNIRPGDPKWFALWFSLPYMTGEKPFTDVTEIKETKKII